MALSLTHTDRAVVAQRQPDEPCLFHLALVSAAGQAVW